MNRDKKAMEEIKNYLVKKLQADFGFCGVAEGENMIMINSGEGNLIIKIEVKE